MAPARADHSRTTLRHIREGVDDPATYGVVPAAPLYTSTIMTTESLKGTSEIKESEISKSNRLPGPRRETALSGGGDVNVECMFCPELDAFLEDACCDTWNGVGKFSGTNISAANGDNSFSTLSATAFAGLKAGDYVDISGFVAGANNKRWLITSKPSGTKIIVATSGWGGGAVTTEAAGATVVVNGGRIVTLAVSAAASDNSINDASGLLFANVPIGAWLGITGFATSGNNGRAYVLDKPSATKLILAYVVLTDEAVGATVTLASRILRDGVKNMTRTFERDIPSFSTNRYQAYKGQYCNGMELTFTFNELMKGKFTYTGRGPEAASASTVGTGAPIAGVPAVNIVDVSNNMRAFRTSGALDGNIRTLTITLGNNGELIRLAQTKYPDGVTMGVAALTGTLEGYLLDASGRQVKAFNRTAESYHFEIVDDIGKVYIVTIWRLLYNDKGDAAKSARTGPIMQSLPFAAEEDPTIGHWIQFAAID